ncbi:MAG: hypothetical protein ACT4P3_12745 [Betaproteobacteria bacterium]
MKTARAILLASLVVPALPAAAAPEDGERVLGHMLTLVQSVVRIGAHAETPQESLRAFDEMLAGRNAEVNRAVMGLFDEMTFDLSDRNRERIAAIGRDLATIGRKDMKRDLERKSAVDPLRARKDLNAMGLRYYDDRQFLDAVKRNDELAVELYIAGRGVDLAGRDADGRSALDIARDNGNAPLAELLARNLPAAR